MGPQEPVLHYVLAVKRDMPEVVPETPLTVLTHHVPPLPLSATVSTIPHQPPPPPVTLVSQTMPSITLPPHVLPSPQTPTVSDLPVTIPTVNSVGMPITGTPPPVSFCPI